MPEVKIGNVTVGTGRPPFVIAETGINHNGDLEKAFEMIKVAKAAGADAVKFQTFKAEEFVNDHSQMFTYKSQGKEVTESMLAMFKRYELSPASWKAVRDRCDREGIMFLSTPQNRSDLDLLLELGMRAIKVGSDDFTNIPLLKDYASTGLPMIVSMGMSNIAEVFLSLEAIGALDGYPTVLLLCTSLYPTPADEVNLNRLKTLMAAFPMIPVGFSDHSQGMYASLMAVGLGASVIEKHFTLDHNLPGPDHWLSDDPADLRALIAAIRTAYAMMGDGLVRTGARELVNKKEFQRVVVAGADIKEGEMLTEEKLTMRRVTGGDGLPPSIIKHLMGTRARRNYKAGEVITL